MTRLDRFALRLLALADRTGLIRKLEQQLHITVAKLNAALDENERLRTGRTA
jgi:hypothetical protein